jgi:hypothetical protein
MSEISELVRQIEALKRRVAILESAGCAPPYNVSDSNPTANDDETYGYQAGSLWINTSTPGAYICITAGEAAADWNKID